jgi:hypothetical protein
MADIDLTKKIVKALDPNFLLAQENLITDMDIARKIDTSSKTKAGLNYIKKGIEKIYRSSATANATTTPPPPEFKITNPAAESKTRKWRNLYKSKKSSTKFNVKNPAADPSYVEPATFTGSITSGGSTRKTRKRKSNVSTNSKRR